MSVPLGRAPLGTPYLSHSPVFPTVLGLGPFPVFLTLATPSDALPLSPMYLPTALFIVPGLTLKYPPLLGVCPIPLLVAVVLVSPHRLGSAACRGPPSGLRCDPATLWWGVSSFPWPVITTSGSCSTLPLSYLLIPSPQYPYLLYSPFISCTPGVIPENALLPSVVLVGLPIFSVSGTSYDPPTSMLPLKYTPPFPVPETLVY